MTSSADKLSEQLIEFINSQEKLPPELEKCLRANLWKLYDSTPAQPAAPVTELPPEPTPKGDGTYACEMIEWAHEIRACAVALQVELSAAQASLARRCNCEYDAHGQVLECEHHKKLREESDELENRLSAVETEVRSLLTLLKEVYAASVVDGNDLFKPELMNKLTNASEGSKPANTQEGG